MPALATGIVSDPDVMDGEPVKQGRRFVIETIKYASTPDDLGAVTWLSKE